MANTAAAAAESWEEITLRYDYEQLCSADNDEVGTAESIIRFGSNLPELRWPSEELDGEGRISANSGII